MELSDRVVACLNNNSLQLVHLYLHLSLSIDLITEWEGKSVGCILSMQFPSLKHFHCESASGRIQFVHAIHSLEMMRLLSQNFIACHPSLKSLRAYISNYFVGVECELLKQSGCEKYSFILGNSLDDSNVAAIFEYLSTWPNKIHKLFIRDAKFTMNKFKSRAVQKYSDLFLEHNSATLRFLSVYSKFGNTNFFVDYVLSKCPLVT